MTHAVFSKDYGRELGRSQVFLGGINGSKRAHILKSQMKIMLITFFNIMGTVHSEFNPQGRTVKQGYYVEILKQLCETVHRKRPELRPNDWILHHDNAPAHKVLSSSFWPKNQLLKWNTHPILLIWF